MLLNCTQNTAALSIVSSPLVRITNVLICVFQMDDLKQFVIILLVFLVSYGISLEAVMFPGPGQYARNDTWKSIVGVLEKPYWQMYGELFLEDITGKLVKMSRLLIVAFCEVITE